MKKLLDSKFLFIVALSLVVLIILGIGAFYLFDKDESTFIKSGYVLNPLSEKSEKYYFDEDTGYRQNLSSMIVFKDTDNNDVSILKDSFLHYNDGSLSFLTNGAILDLGSIKGKNAVDFYNITNASIIEKNSNGYVIKSAGGDIKLNNFIGRISDNKYIVVGKLSAKIPGNNANIETDYFEIVYMDEGIVSIENKDNKYQVTAEGTLIYVGDMVIDLGNKKITKNNEDIMSLTAITINGDENVEIIPKVEDKKDTDNKDGNGNNGQDNTGNQGNGQNETPNNGDRQDGSGNNNEITEVSQVSLKDANVGSNYVNLTFDTATDDGNTYTLNVTNLDNNQVLDRSFKVKKDEGIPVDMLSPDTHYLFTVTNDSDGSKYFQKVFTTSGFEITLEKSYATDSSLAYKIKVGKDTDITDARLTLYKFNEVTKKNETVTTSYYDAGTGRTIESVKQVNLANLDDSVVGTHEVLFDGLESNTIYTAVLDEFSRGGANFADAYEIPLTLMTLKETPKFNKMEMTVTKNSNNESFKLALNNIPDKDNAIVNYTYLIYEYGNDDETVISPITNNNASPIEVKIGDGDNQLKNDTNYYYRVVIEYYDNEKYIEYVKGDSINFVMGSDPYITVVPVEDKITYNAIAAEIYLIDNSCLISMPGRERCNAESTFVLDVSKINAITGEKTSVFTRIVDFEISDNQLKYDLKLDNLQAGTTYMIEARAVRNDQSNNDRVEILHSEDSKRNITTKTLASFTEEWIDMGSNANHVINLENRLIAENGSGTLSPDETAKAIKRIVLKLYEGNYVDNIQSVNPIATKTFTNTDEFNIKENFYDNAYSITTDGTFGLDLEALKEKNSDDRISDYYTLAMYAYYDDDEINEVRLTNNIVSYSVSPVLLIDIEDPEIFVAAIANKNSDFKDDLLGDDTVVGYTITSAFDRIGMETSGLEPKKISFYVYNDKGSTVSFYVNDNGTKKLVPSYTATLGENNNYEIKIYMSNGTAYDNDDTIMARGNAYYIGYILDVESERGMILYPNNNNEAVENDYGTYTNVTINKESIAPGKETPKIKMYIAKSTATSITYRYEIEDIDNAIYKEDNYNFYYKINDGDEKKIVIQEVNGEVLSFRGDLTITGLNNGDVYSLYYKKNVSKTGNFENDILNYYDGENDNSKLFDGYYDSSDIKYNFKYEVINNPLVDNRVTIKILASEDMLDRILSYKINFRDTKGNTLDKEIWELSECTDGSIRCYMVDYVELKNKGMKSANNEINTIKVTVTALYDNGLTGYDYTVGEGKDYPYMIMQNNNTKTEYGNYIAFSSRGLLTTWSNELNAPKGYYTYTFGSRINYNSKLNTNHNANIAYTLTSNGYASVNNGIMNPKMVSISNMNSENDTFSFSSITPKVTISKTNRIINGAVINMLLSGADIDDFCEESTGNNCVNTANGDIYLYIEVWDNEANVGDSSKKVIPTVKVKVDNNNPNQLMNVVIDKVANSSKYYYNVYAYLNKSNVKTYTQLFDGSTTNKNAVKTYSFTSLQSDDIFKDFTIDYNPSLEGDYNDKLFNTKINLLPYSDNLAFNFDVSYAFCLTTDADCGIEDDNTNIFKSTVATKDVKTSFSDIVDISNYDLEYDTNYKMNIYAIYDYYDMETQTIVKRKLYLNRMNSVVKLRKLTTPEFIITREANYIDGDYIIDFGINVSDSDRVLTNGEYFIKLEDSDGNIVGNLQVKDDNGNYVTVAYDGDYKDYAFDASVANRTVRITGLTDNTKYTITVYSEAYINNYSEETPKEDRNMAIEKYHTVYSSNVSGVAFGDVLFSATEKSIIATFLGGSSFDNVVELNYTIGIWDDLESISTFSGSYEIPKDKRFEYMRDSEVWRFVIDPNDMNNVLGQTYNVTISVSVYNPETEEINYYDSTVYPKFADRVQYNKD